VIALWLAMLTGGPPPATPIPPVTRIYSSPTLHIGIRPAILATPYEVGSGITVQITALRFL
jgi:hypothetical protein